MILKLKLEERGIWLPSLICVIYHFTLFFPFVNLSPISPKNLFFTHLPPPLLFSPLLPLILQLPITALLFLSQWLAEVYRSQGLLVQAVMAYRQCLQLASQLDMHNSQVASLLRLALLALRPCMVRSCIRI